MSFKQNLKFVLSVFLQHEFANNDISLLINGSFEMFGWIKFFMGKGDVISNEIISGLSVSCKYNQPSGVFQ